MATATLNSTAYVLGITKSSIFSSFYKIFYNRIIANVADIRSPARNKYVYPAFPSNLIDNSDSYPIIIINSPEISWDKFTLTKKWAMATIDIEVFVTKQEQLDSMSDSILAAIEGSYPTFDGIQIRMVQQTGSTTDHIIRDQITIHNKVLTFTCQWSFSRSL